MYTCRKELECMKTSINHLKPDKELPFREKYRHTLKRLLSKEFLKPFLFLNLILNIGLEWAGFPALAFYMHTILKQMEIPLDEYWVAVALAGYRSALTIGLSFVLYKVTSECDIISSCYPPPRPGGGQCTCLRAPSCVWPRPPCPPTTGSPPASRPPPGTPSASCPWSPWC